MYQNCPKCGSKKRQLMACPNCGYVLSKRKGHVKKIKYIKKRDLTADQQRNQRLGFHDGAKVPGSNIRKIDK